MELTYKHTYNSTNSVRLPFIDWNIRLFGAHMQTVHKGWSVEMESHHAFEIILLLDGKQETSVEKDLYQLNAGDIMLIPPGHKHASKIVETNSMTYFCAHFDIDEPHLRIEMLKNCELIYNPSSPFYQRLKLILEKWLHILTVGDIESVKNKLQVQIVLFELLIVFADIVSVAHEDTEYCSKESMTTTKYAKEIADAIKLHFRKGIYNKEDINQSILIQPIIASLGLSPNYGLEIFQKVYHMSPRKYLSELKLQEAKILIQQPNISLKEISHLLGYKNLSHFSRQFKRWTGKSPTKFRQDSI